MTNIKILNSVTKSFQILSVIIFVPSISMAEAISLATACSPKIVVPGEQLRIPLAKDREVFLIGGFHTDPVILPLAMQTIFDRDAEPTAYRARLTTFLAQQTDTLKSLRRQYDVITQYSKSEGSKFIGTEFSKSEIDKWKADAVFALKNVKEQLRKASILDDKTVEDVLLLLHTPVLTFLALHPSAADSIVGLDENRDSKARTVDLTLKYLKLRKTLESQKESQDQLAPVWKLISQIEKTGALPKPEEVETSVAGIRTSKTKESAQKMIEAVAGIVREYILRDQGMANKLSGTSGNGIAVVGQNHLPGITRNLTKQCSEQNSKEVNATKDGEPSQVAGLTSSRNQGEK